MSDRKWKEEKKCGKFFRENVQNLQEITMHHNIWLRRWKCVYGSKINTHTHKLENIFLDEFIELLTQGVR